MSQHAFRDRVHVPFTELIDLASAELGGKVLFASDEFFAPKENLILPTQAIFITDKFTDVGKWMDGWESRRKRLLGPGNDRDFCVVRLGASGVIRGVDVDTAHFIGNFPEYCSIQALNAPDGNEIDFTGSDADWKEIVPKTRLLGDTRNLLPVADSGRFTHVRLTIFPDGGVARMRVHGEIIPDEKKRKGLFDLAAAENGGTVVACNDMFFGKKDNLILPGRAKVMGEGWETRRRRGPGHDWIVVRLAVSGRLCSLEIDTNHFKGNFPESASVEACSYPQRDLRAADLRDRTDLAWTQVLPRTKLQADHRHLFERELSRAAADRCFDYLRLNIFPDGGVSRLRAFGVAE